MWLCDKIRSLFRRPLPLPRREGDIPSWREVDALLTQAANILKALKQKAEQEALKAQPKPTPTPLPPVDIFAPYHAPSLLDSIPRRDHQPIYVRPELVPSPTPLPTPQPKSRPTPKPTRKTFYVR